MIFNEYVDILKDGDIFFLDEENILNIMLEMDYNDAKNYQNNVNKQYQDSKSKMESQTEKLKQAKSQQKPPVSNGLNSNDSTATDQEKKEDPSGQSQQNTEKTKEQGKNLFTYFKIQSSKLAGYASDQMGKIRERISNLGNKLKQAPKDYNGQEEVEIPVDNFESTPKFDRPSNTEDPAAWNSSLGKFKQRIKEWTEKKKQSRKKFVKGAATVAGGWWLLKYLQKMSGEIDINFKEGKFYTSMGMGQASKAAGGNSFAASVGLIIKNVFLAILVLIGGLFKVLKEYFAALGKIIGTIFNTVGKAGKTLVTGEM